MKNSVSVLALAIATALVGGCANSTGNWKEALMPSGDVANYEDKLSRGIYAVAGIGPSRLEPDTSELPGWDPNDRVEPAGQVTLGVDLTKHLSVEAHSADLGSAGLSPTGRINYHIDGVSALVYAGGNRDRFRRQGLKPYGRVGLGILNNSAVGDVSYVKDNATHILIGAGVEYMTPIGVGLRAEGVSFDEDIKYAQLGLMYRTGAKQEVKRPKLAEAPVQQPVVAAAVPEPTVYTAPDRCEALGGMLTTVGFHTDSAQLTSQSISELDEITYTLDGCESVGIQISAHTDARGSESYNQDLSIRRAESVVNYLNNRGMDRAQLSMSAYGELSPIDTNDTEDGRRRNRRVEVYVQ